MAEYEIDYVVTMNDTGDIISDTIHCWIEQSDLGEEEAIQNIILPHLKFYLTENPSSGMYDSEVPSITIRTPE